ncbi:MAG TPA: hypothetical protein VEZ70_02660 [Allosphingosinicella sp.]|nr:hypothetical protein [Allosphingosinicella sp.]
MPAGDGDAPVFLYFPKRQRAPVRLTAHAGGVLTRRGQCLGIVGSDGRFATLYWPASARMEVDARGLVVVDRRGGGRVRLGDDMVFTGGPVPRGTAFQLGETPMECARWPGYEGWLAMVNSGFRAAEAPTAPRGHLPVARGLYVARPHMCAEASSLFHYDGESMAWISPGHSSTAAYPIMSVRQEDGRWVATISAPGPGVHGARDRRSVRVSIVPEPSGLVSVDAYGREEMRLCGPDEVPAWARQHAPN